MVHDVVIIGAGPSGLAAAARLAHFGIGVCVLEAHNRAGGLNSWHHVRGREVSSGLHAFTNYSPHGRGGPLGKLLRQLRLKYADFDLRPQTRSSIRFPSATLAFTNEPEFFRAQVAAAFPGQIDAFDRFRRLILDTDEGELTDRRISAREVAGRFLSDPLLVDMLFCTALFYGGPGGVGDGRDAERAADPAARPDMDWLLFCVIWKCIFESGLAHPARGIRPLWEMLARRIVEDGGTLRLSTRVERLAVEDGKVAAAVLAGGEEVRGLTFLSSAGGAETERLLGVPDASTRPVGPISIVEGVSLLDAPPPEAGLEDAVVFFSHEDRLRFGRPESLCESSSGVVCASGNYHPADPADANVVKISLLASYPAWRRLSREAYINAKRETAVGMKAVLARLGIVPAAARKKAGRYGIFDDFYTPLTIERYTHHPEGALYGSPVKSRNGDTAYPNLFLMGTDQGFHGIVGAMLSGVAMANLHCLKHA